VPFGVRLPPFAFLSFRRPWSHMSGTMTQKSSKSRRVFHMLYITLALAHSTTATDLNNEVLGCNKRSMPTRLCGEESSSVHSLKLTKLSQGVAEMMNVLRRIECVYLLWVSAKIHDLLLCLEHLLGWTDFTSTGSSKHLLFLNLT
jgi:hypothetical protein